MEPLNPFGSKSREMLTIQDALLTIAVCAAELDDDAGYDDIIRIAALALAHPLFSNKIETVTKRIYNLANFIIGAADPMEAVDLAVESLPSQLRETAFAWTADMVMAAGLLPDEKRGFLEKFTTKLSIDGDVAKKIIEVTAIRNRTI